MNTKFAFILGVTMMLTACNRHPDTVIVQPDAQSQQAYVQQQPAYVQQPNTVVVERDNSGDVVTGVAAGMVMGHLLSHSYGSNHHSNYYSPSHTTIIHNNTYVHHTTSNVGTSPTSVAPVRSYSMPRSYSSRSVTVSRSYRAKSVHVSPFAQH